MNQLLRAVAHPPIVDFKNAAAKIKPASRALDFSQALPAYPTFPKVTARLKEDLSDPALGFYTDIRGIEPLRKKIAETHSLAGWSADQVIVTPGANYAMFLSLLSLFTPGDEVVLVEPYYFNHDMALRMLGLKPKYFSVKESNGFRLIAEKAISFLKTNRGVKGIVLITPNNPTGAAYAPSEVARLLSYCADSGLEVLIDETYGAFDETHLREKSLSQFVGKNLTLLGSFSKSYSLSGYRVGYLLSSNGCLEQALKVQDTATICTPHIGQKAALHAMNLCADDLARERKRWGQLLALVGQAGHSLKHFRIASTGPFFLYLKHPYPDLTGQAAALKFFEKTGILGLPGSFFGESQAPYIRLAYGNLGEEGLSEALTRLTSMDKTL